MLFCFLQPANFNGYPTITEALITPLIKLTSVFLEMCSSNSQCICNWMNQDQGSVSGTFRVYNLEFEHLPQKIFTLKTISVKIYVGDDFIISCCTLWNLKLWGDKHLLMNSVKDRFGWWEAFKCEVVHLLDFCKSVRVIVFCQQMFNLPKSVSHHAHWCLPIANM